MEVLTGMERTRPVLTTVNCFEIVPIIYLQSSVRVTRRGGKGSSSSGKGR
jgi:hypothetical protein